MNNTKKPLTKAEKKRLVTNLIPRNTKTQLFDTQLTQYLLGLSQVDIVATSSNGKTTRLPLEINQDPIDLFFNLLISEIKETYFKDIHLPQHNLFSVWNSFLFEDLANHFHSLVHEAIIKKTTTIELDSNRVMRSLFKNTRLFEESAKLKQLNFTRLENILSHNLFYVLDMEHTDIFKKMFDPHTFIREYATYVETTNNDTLSARDLDILRYINTLCIIVRSNPEGFRARKDLPQLDFIKNPIDSITKLMNHKWIRNEIIKLGKGIKPHEKLKVFKTSKILLPTINEFFESKFNKPFDFRVVETTKDFIQATVSNNMTRISLMYPEYISMGKNLLLYDKENDNVLKIHFFEQLTSEGTRVKVNINIGMENYTTILFDGIIELERFIEAWSKNHPILHVPTKESNHLVEDLNHILALNSDMINMKDFLDAKRIEEDKDLKHIYEIRANKYKLNNRTPTTYASIRRPTIMSRIEALSNHMTTNIESLHLEFKLFS